MRNHGQRGANRKQDGGGFPTCNGIVSLSLRDAGFIKESLRFLNGESS